MSTFFFLDAVLIPECTKTNYALKVVDGDKKLLAIRFEPFNLLLYGDKECVAELLRYVARHEYEFEGITCSETLGEDLPRICKEAIGKEYTKLIGMDFMKATLFTEESSEEVTTPNANDVEEIYDLMCAFLIECGLPDKPRRDRIEKEYDQFKIIRRDSKIAALTRKAVDTEESYRISSVYTRPEYRGQGLARKVVNALKNEILEEGNIATLNVDQANPISNHLYASLGFEKVFAQTIFMPK